MRKLYYSFGVVAIALLLFSCAESKISFPGVKNIQYESIDMERIVIDSVPNTSYVVFSGICNDSLYMFDDQLDYFYTVSVDGTLGKRELGLGHGPGEIAVPEPLCVSYNTKSNSLYLMGGTLDAYIYDRKTSKRIDLKSKGTDDSFDSPNAYTVFDEINMVAHGDKFYYNITGNNEAVDFVHNERYFKDARIMMEVDIKDGKMKPIGKYSDYYVDRRNSIRHLPKAYFDVADNGDFYVCYMADSLIYHYDESFNLIESFGYVGLGMNLNYSDSGTTEESVVNAYTNDMETVGYFFWIKQVGDYIFRSYKKSGDAENDGLQIFKAQTLVADVDVPKGLKVSGYVKPYFVTQIQSDEEASKLYFYRFKLEE